MVEYRFRKKCVLLDRLWKLGDTIMLPEDFFEVKGWKVPPHMELASEPDLASPNPKDTIRAVQGTRDHSGETPEERAVRETNEAKAAGVPDTGPSDEDDDGLGL